MGQDEGHYDILVVGGGPGGYVAALRAARLGFRAACVDSRETLGGVCLNVGCIPSKALLVASEHYEMARNGELAALGVRTGEVEPDLAAMMAHKDRVVRENAAGIDFLFRRGRITRLVGTASLEGAGRVRIAGETSRTVTAAHIILATGSVPATLPGIAIDESVILSSTGALSLERVPRTLAVIGGGAIGLEMAVIWSRLGARVTVVEFLDHILPGMDREVSAAAQGIFAARGISFRLSTRVVRVDADGDGARLTLSSGGGEDVLEAEKVLVAVGRKPFFDGLGLETAGVATRDGRIVTDGNFTTRVPGIHAIGDVIAGPMLAHRAEHDGIACVERIAGQKPCTDYGRVPAVVYTRPEIAGVGRTEEELQQEGIPFRKGIFPFASNGRARASRMTEGFVKLLACGRTGRLLGGHIIGADAGSLIHECVLALEFGASAEDIALSSHAHPTMNEAVREAALDVHGQAIHR